MNLTPSLQEIQACFKQSLPGPIAMQALVPRVRRGNLARAGNPPPCRHAGALLLLYPHAGAWYLPLTRRSESLETHKGQISLPGGSHEGDEALHETALREAHEEVGADPAQIQLLGPLSSVYIPPSNFCLHPFVAHTARRPEFRPLAAEVAELIEVPLSLLRDPATLREEEWPLQGQRVRVPFYQIGPHKVWGATAMVLAEFLAVLMGQAWVKENSA